MLLIALFALPMGLTSCGNDDDDDLSGMDKTEIVSKLQGAWEFYSGKETLMGMTITMDKSSLDEMKSMISSNVRIWDETLDFNGFKVNGVSYGINGNQLVIDGMELFDGFTITIKSLTSSVLVLHEEIDLDGINIVADMEYHKK